MAHGTLPSSDAFCLETWGLGKVNPIDSSRYLALPAGSLILPQSTVHLCSRQLSREEREGDWGGQCERDPKHKLGVTENGSAGLSLADYVSTWVGPPVCDLLTLLGDVC